MCAFIKVTVAIIKYSQKSMESYKWLLNKKIIYLYEYIFTCNMNKTLTLIFVLIFITNTIMASNYYFSTSKGNDTFSTIKAQNPATPWRTLTKLNSFINSLQPGDSVLFKRGDIFTGTIQLTNSGAIGLPLIFASYGTGPKPVINGFTKLIQWVNVSSNIWESTCTTCGNSVNILLLHGKVMAMGRYPNSNAPNKGYLTIKSHVTTTSITDSVLPATPNWTGAELVLRPNHWILDRDKITQHSGNTISYTSNSRYEPFNTYGYFIQNHPNTLDQNGEWFFDSVKKKMTLYNTTDPNGSLVQVSTVDTLVLCDNQSNILFDNISFEGANKIAILTLGSLNVTFQNSKIAYSGIDGINCGGDYITLSNDTLLYTNNNAITLNGNNCTIDNNIVLNTALFAGMGKSLDGNYNAIQTNGISNSIQRNTLESVGYIPIDFNGDNALVKNNFINFFNLVKDDGGGIYTWVGAGNVPSKNQIIDHNIILNGTGAPEGTDKTISTHGIYLDDNAANITLTGNTIDNCGSGIFLHNCNNTFVSDNTCYNSQNQLYMLHQPANCTACPMQNNNLTNNIFFAKKVSQQTADFQTRAGDDIGGFGLMDSNYYCRPLADNLHILTSYLNSGQVISNTSDLAGWQALYSYDKSSKKSPFQITPYTINNLIGNNLINNGAFDSNINGLYCYSPVKNCSLTWSNAGKLDGGALQYSPTSAVANNSYIIISVGPVSSSKNYILRFSTLGTKNNKSIGLFLRQSFNPYENLTPIGACKLSTTRMENEYLFSFPTSENNGSLVFRIDQSDSTIWLDNIQLYEANVNLTNPDNYIRFEYNTTSKVKSIPLTGSWDGCRDIKNKSYTGNVNLAPYTSVILLQGATLVGSNPIIERNTDVCLYPNPAMTAINFNLKYLDDNEPVKIEIETILGEVVFSSRILNNKNGLQMNIEKLNSGLYFLCVASKNGIYKSKFIKSE
jgi:parallel beta-helix repeat protein